VHVADVLLNNFKRQMNDRGLPETGRNLERKMGKLNIEQLAEILLAIAWTIDLFDTVRQS